ncbi:related to small s protein [Fusarium oxysporum]|uniref:Related to small s protein n=1 Tax=Fusarium oxysporum TaxID=5507 RepID=A0A2H3TVK9_FUSOX|nr:related to small s protein [Fusarium oxysporum]
MEVAGLTLGAVALVSLFKDCVDLFSMITAARDLGKDAALLDTKLDVERTLFLQWSERVGLLKQDSTNTLFCDEDTRQIVSRVLESVKSLLSESQALQRDYGLKKVDVTKPTTEYTLTESTTGYKGVSSHRFARFLKQFEALKIQTTDADRQSKFKRTTKQFRWVVLDKFNYLIDHLSYFNSSLNNLVPLSVEPETASYENDMIHIKDFAELDLVIQATANTRPSISKAATAAKSALIQSRILRSLWFRSYDDRRINIKDPHYQTLWWALDPPSDYTQWDDLNTWLQSASGLYWVSGKAGSGKSTLMKYLDQHDKTHALIRTWANSSELIFASFFFYALGRSEQKSQSGLLRSLLYQLLERDPIATESALPHMWREACYSQQSFQNIEVPPVAEMTAALRDLCSRVHADKKIFFLIDGIDEYDGKDLDIARFIHELESFPNVKILVSSRPHPAFFTAFSQKPMMRLQDLTKHDVATYVHDVVASHPYMAIISRLSPLETGVITKGLVEKASGVFLWVVLACRSVIEGCDEPCTITELRERVDELPKEVEDLIEHMLEKIDPRWKQEAMKLIHLVYTNEPWDTHPIPTLGLYLTHENGLSGDTGLLGMNLDQVPFTEMESQCRIMEGRIRSRCCGLLEVYNYHLDVENIEECTVRFMHRTVYDMLLQPDVANRLFRDIQRESFNSFAVLSEIWCRMIHTEPGSELIYANALSPVKHGDISGCPPEITLHLLSRLQFLFGQFIDATWWRSSPEVPRYIRHNKECRRHCDDLSVTFPLALEMGMYNVVRFILENKNSLGHLLFRPPNIALLGDCRVAQSVSCNLCHQFSYQDDRQILQGIFPLIYHVMRHPLLETYFDWGDGLWDSDGLHLMQLILTIDANSQHRGKEMGRRQSATVLVAELSLQGLDGNKIGELFEEINKHAENDHENREEWGEVKRLCEEQLKAASFGRDRQTKQPLGMGLDTRNTKRKLSTDDSMESSGKRQR